MINDEAKKIAEAIVIAVSSGRTGESVDYANLIEIIIAHLTTDTAAPVEKEHRAGKWVPTTRVKYWFFNYKGKIDWNPWDGDAGDNYRLSQGNVFPAEAIAEAAKKHAEFWRAFDMADEGGKVSIWSWANGELHVSANDSKDSNPRWQSIESARTWVESHGGEAYVSEMLTKGRMFRFKWGGE